MSILTEYVPKSKYVFPDRGKSLNSGINVNTWTWNLAFYWANSVADVKYVFVGGFRQMFVRQLNVLKHF